MRERRDGAEELEELEIDLLLEAVLRRCGMDFRGYARVSLARRVKNLLQTEGLGTISALQERVLHHPDALARLVEQIPVSVTSMFRDPSFFAAFRAQVVPQLFTQPFVRVWHAGCATGEEAYSLAILLSEAGVYERCRIYATDLSASAVAAAKAGIYRLDRMQEYTANYQQAGGLGAFSDHYTANYDHAIMKASLKKNIVFAQHNLVTDHSFNEFNVILCRNVMIYFDEPLQQRVHGLLYQSLRHFGVLGLGQRESLIGSVHARDFEILDPREQLYRRTGWRPREEERRRQEASPPRSRR